MFSEDGAWAAFEENERGRLAPGFRADLTVLTRDITRIPPREILDTRVALTVVGGRVVHTGPNAAGPSAASGAAGARESR